MANYFVAANGGSDSNSGTSEGSPWATLAKAVGSGVSTPVVQGDVIHLRGGTHTISATVTPAAGATGASGNPVQIKAYTGETPVINFTGGANFWFPINGSVHYYTFSGLEWTGGALGQFGESNSEINGLIFEDCYGHDISASGEDNVSLLRLDRCVGYIVRRCTFYGVTAPSGFNANAIKLYSGYNGLVEDCFFEHCRASGFEQKHGHPSNPATAVEIRRCVFKDMYAGYGVILAPTGTQSAIFGVKVHHCLFDSSAIWSIHTDTSNQCTGLEFYNNTLILPPNQRGVQIRGITQMVFHSNIFFGTHPTGGDDPAAGAPGVGRGDFNSLAICSDMANFNLTPPNNNALWNVGWTTLDRSCYYHIGNNLLTSLQGGWERDENGVYGGGPSQALYGTLAEWQAASSTSPGTSFPANKEANSITSDPLLTNQTFAVGGYTLGVGSPCLGAGLGGVDMGWSGAAAAPAASKVYALPGKSRRRVFAF